MFFDKVVLAPLDPLFGLREAYQRDQRAHKMDLSIGVFKTEDLQTPILSSVKKAEALILEEETSKEYLSISGDETYLNLTGALIFGEDFWSHNASRISAIQAIGGTGALRLGADFLQAEVGSAIYCSQPTWVNHLQMMQQMQMHLERYPYYNKQTHLLEFEKMVAFLEKLPEKSIILLHAACHNPTGADLSLAEWQQLSALFFAKKLIPFFDCAYQGFGRGLAQDAEAIRFFAHAGHEILVAYSFSKNFGLYGERVGGLFVVTENAQNAQHVLSQLKVLARTHFSNPPIHGASIVAHLLSHPLLKKEWEQELAMMRGRINEMRLLFASTLSSQAKQRDYTFLYKGLGFFCFCGLHEHEVERLIREYGIYMTRDGRVNVVGIKKEKMSYLVDAILKVSET